MKVKWTDGAMHDMERLFSHRWRYSIPRWFNEWYWNLKYAWQRAKRGYDERFLFSFHYEHSKMTLEALKWLRDCKHGTPVIIDDYWQDMPGDGPAEDKQKKNEEAWKIAITKMIDGFEAKLAQDDVFIETDGKYDPEKSNAKVQELEKIWEEGMALFTKHYCALWD